MLNPLRRYFRQIYTFTVQNNSAAVLLLQIFDAELTGLGANEASALNSQLNGGGWFQTLTGGALLSILDKTSVLIMVRER